MESVGSVARRKNRRDATFISTIHTPPLRSAVSSVGNVMRESKIFVTPLNIYDEQQSTLRKTTPDSEPPRTNPGSAENDMENNGLAKRSLGI